MDGGVRTKTPNKTPKKSLSLVEYTTPSKDKLMKDAVDIAKGTSEKLKSARRRYKPRPIGDRYPATISDFIVQYGPEDLVKMYENVDIEGMFMKIRKVAAVISKGRVRGLFDPVQANIQCNLAIGGNSDTSPCWLCGLTIKELGDKMLSVNPSQQVWSSSNKNPNVANAPECEHILPSAVAVQYFDVIADKGTSLTLQEKTYFSLNYRWSHRRCNNEKSNLLFLKVLRSDGEYPHPITTFDEVIKLYLKNMRRIFDEQMGIKFEDGWEEKRLESIKSDCSSLIKNMNNTYEVNGALGILANAALRQERIDKLFDNIKDAEKIFDKQIKAGNHKTFRRKI